jgi:hypothetical protein
MEILEAFDLTGSYRAAAELAARVPDVFADHRIISGMSAWPPRTVGINPASADMKFSP